MLSPPLPTNPPKDERRMAKSHNNSPCGQRGLFIDSHIDSKKEQRGTNLGLAGRPQKGWKGWDVGIFWNERDLKASNPINTPSP